MQSIDLSYKAPVIKTAIVGRPNTGNSSLFNRITKSRQALVFDEGGITRDVLRQTVSLQGRSVEIMDLPGFHPKVRPSHALTKKIQTKFYEAFLEADALIVVADARAGVLPEDKSILELSRSSGKPFLFFINKSDSLKKQSLLSADFYRLHPYLIAGSCERMFGISEIEDWIVRQIQKIPNPPPTESPGTQKRKYISRSKTLRLPQTFRFSNNKPNIPNKPGILFSQHAPPFTTKHRRQIIRPSLKQTLYTPRTTAF